MPKHLPFGWWIIPGAILGLRLWIWALAAVLALGGCMAQPATRDTVIRQDWDGEMQAYRQRVGGLLFTSDKVRVSDVCASACTLYLVLGDRVCTTRGARWGFHAAYDARTGRVLPAATRELENAYPPGLAAWFRANAAHRTGRDMAWRTGEQMIKRVWVKEC